MKTETLDALLLDRALGQLPPETAELVEEYLVQNPAAAARAGALGETVGLARAAVSVDAPAATMRGPESWSRAQRTARWHGVLAQGWKLAACLAVGLAVGWAARRPERVASAAPAVVAEAAPQVQGRARKGAENAAAAFWIAARRAAETNERAAQLRKATWETPGAASATGGAR